jgi:hypothetical protein
MTDERVDAYLDGLDGWKRDTAARLRQLIREAVPDIDETWKWGTPVYVARVNVCAIGVFKDHVKVNFFKGAAVPDPAGLFNAGLDAKTMRSIDFHEGDVEQLDEETFRQLVRAAATGGST